MNQKMKEMRSLFTEWLHHSEDTHGVYELRSQLIGDGPLNEDYSIDDNGKQHPFVSAITKYHSTDGYLTVQEPPWSTPLVTAFIQGGVEMGYSHLDVNAAQQTGLLFQFVFQNFYILLKNEFEIRIYANSVNYAQWGPLFNVQGLFTTRPSP